MPTKAEVMLQIMQTLEAERQKRLQYLNDLIDALDLQNGWSKPDLIFTTREQAEFMGLKIEETEENDID